MVDVGRQDRDAQLGALGEGGGDARVAARWMAARQREQCRQVLGRVVRLEVGRLVGDGGVADGVRLVEGVAGEGQDQLEDLLRLPFGVAVALRASDKPVAFRAHHLRDLLAHRLAHDIGLAQGVAGELLGDEQHLVLIGDHAVGFVQGAGQIGVWVGDGLQAVLHSAVGGDVLHGARPVERHHGGQLGDAVRLELLDVPAHAGRF